MRRGSRSCFLNESEKEEKNMSGIMMMVIAIVVLGGAYIFYGRYLEKKWGIGIPTPKLRLMKWKTA